MKILDRLQSWARAMEDIEDPARSELRRLRERVRVLETEQAAAALNDQRNAR